MLKRLFFFTLFLFFVIQVWSQVGINTEKPNSLTVLDVTNVVTNGEIDPKGIMIPRMSVEDRDKIDVSTPANANSLLIYNTDENCYNYFSSTDAKWKSLCGDMGRAEFTINCTEGEALGAYNKGQALDGSDLIKLEVEVTKAGSYAISIPSDNGYFFTELGVFPEIGTFTIYVNGSGTPKESGIKANKIYNYSIDTGCAVNVNVLGDAATYDMSCALSTPTQIQNDPTTTTGVFGSYKVGVAVNPTDNFIRMKVNATTLGSWEASTNTVDGLSFSGSGEFTQLGDNFIVLKANGTPTTSYDKICNVFTNTVGGENNSCNVVVKMTIPKKRIVDFGSSGYTLLSASTTNGFGNVFKNSANFGEDNYSIVKTVTPELINGGNGYIRSSDIKKYIDPTQPATLCDIVVFGYGAEISSDIIPDLINYLNNGGVFFYFNEHMNSGGNYDNNYKFVQQLFGDNTIAFVGGGSNNVYQHTGAIMQLPNVNDPILNGPFGDLRGKYIGDDRGNNDFIVTSTFSPLYIDWSYNSLDYSGDAENPTGSPSAGNANQTTNGVAYPAGSVFTAGFKAKNFYFFWSGDGGFATTIVGNTNDTGYPGGITASPNYVPIPKAYGWGTNKLDVINSQFVANLVAWGMYVADTDGIRKRVGGN